MSLSLHPFPRFFTPPAGAVAELPITRDGVRNLAQGQLQAGKGPAFAELNIRHYASGRRSRGLCGLLAATHFQQGTVRPHEKTLVSRLKRQEELVLADGGALGKPVLLTVPSLKDWWTAQDKLHETAGPATSFAGNNSVYEVRRYVSAVTDVTGDTLPTLPLPLADYGPLCIADGHHRAETHAILAARGVAECSFIPVCIIGADELRIEAFTRVITDAAPLDKLLPLLEGYFEIEALEMPTAPRHTGEWLLVRDNRYYRLIRRPDRKDMLDNAWFEEIVLPAVFDITDTRIDERITFSPTPAVIAGQLPLRPTAGTTYFAGYPLPTDTFFAEIAAGNCLPPKSTRFEPRVPSGLVVWIPGDGEVVK